MIVICVRWQHLSIVVLSGRASIPVKFTLWWNRYQGSPNDDISGFSNIQNVYARQSWHAPIVTRISIFQIELDSRIPWKLNSNKGIGRIKYLLTRLRSWVLGVPRLLHSYLLPILAVLFTFSSNYCTFD